MFAGQPAFTNVSGGSLTDDGPEHNSKRLLLSRIHACPILDKLFKFSLVMRTFQAWQAGTANVVPRKMRRAMSAAKPYRSRRVSGRPPVRQYVSHSAAMAGRRDLQYRRPWTGRDDRAHGRSSSPTGAVAEDGWRHGDPRSAHGSPAPRSSASQGRAVGHEALREGAPGAAAAPGTDNGGDRGAV